MVRISVLKNVLEYVVLLLGVQAAGKRTQGRMMHAEYGFFHIDMGDYLRSLENKKNRSAAEEHAFKCQKAGELVPDSTILMIYRRLIEEALKFGQTRVILDGCARTTVQADGIMRDLKIHFPEAKVIAIHLDLPQEEAKERMRRRAIAEGREDDFNEAAVENRLRNYYESSAGVPEHLEKHHKVPVTTIDAKPSAEEISRDLSLHLSVQLNIKPKQSRASA